MPDRLMARRCDPGSPRKAGISKDLGDVARTPEVPEYIPEPQVDQDKLSLCLGRGDVLSWGCQGQPDRRSLAAMGGFAAARPFFAFAYGPPQALELFFAEDLESQPAGAVQLTAGLECTPASWERWRVLTGAD